MTRFARFFLVTAVALMLGAVLASQAFATPSKTSKCTAPCHTGPNSAVTLSVVQTSTNGATANYTITVGNPYGMTGWGVFNSAGTKLAGNALASSTFSVPVGATYTVYGVSGNGNGTEAFNQISITPAAAPAAPAAPSINTTYNTSTGSVTISWAAVSGATSYDYQVGTGAVTSTTGTSVTLSGLAVGTTAFKVRAVNAGGASAYSNASIVYTAPVVAPAVPLLNATYNTSVNSVTISWAAVSGASSYGYQVGAGAVATTTATSVTLTGLSAGTTVFKLRAGNTAGSSAFSSANVVYTPPSVAPAAPVINATYNTSTGSVTVSWVAVSGASSYGYQVGAGSVITTSATSVTIGGLAVGTTAFKVRATNAVGSSAYANASLVYTLPVLTPPTAPTLAPVYSAPTGELTIQFASVPGATSYEYYLKGGPTQTSDTSSIHLAGLCFGTSTLFVRAVNATGVSSYTVASIETPAPPAFAAFTAKTAAKRHVTFKGRVTGVSAASRVRIAVYIRLSNGKYRKYVYTAPTSASGAFTKRIRLPRRGRAYAIATAYGMQAKSKAFKIRN